ncbi:MAG: phosphopantetheine-binding protein, partial [Candidatus Binatia bacterium]
VVAREDAGGEKRLVAYVVPKQDSLPSVSELRRSLQERLPDYMVPAAFVVMDSLPLLPNGKIDRRALPSPGRARPNLETALVPPRNPTEQELTRIWTEVLDLDSIGVNDSFLDLGGHSLMATRIISRVIEKFQVELPLGSLLGASSVAEMAVVVAQNRANAASEKDLARVLEEVEALSDEEAQRLLPKQGA